MTELKIRRKGANSSDGAFADPILQTGGIAIDQDAYTAGLDRIYDVKGLSNMHIEIKNTGVSNGLEYRIENSGVDFLDVSELVDADFNGIILTDTIVAALAESIQDVIDISPASTAIRIRVRRQTTLLDTTLAGIVSAN